jgi:hypothetical protein
MAGEWRGRLTVPGVVDWPMVVSISLDDSKQITIRSAGFPIGQWNTDRLEVRPREQGFEILIDGEQLFVHTDDDVSFAEALGLGWRAPVTGEVRIGRMGESGSGARSASSSPNGSGLDLRSRLLGTTTSEPESRGRHRRTSRGRHVRD